MQVERAVGDLLQSQLFPFELQGLLHRQFLLASPCEEGEELFLWVVAAAGEEEVVNVDDAGGCQFAVDPLVEEHLVRDGVGGSQ